MGISFYKDGTTYSLKEYTGSEAEFSLAPAKLAYRKNGSTYYAIGVSTQGSSVSLGTSGNYSYSANTSSPTIAFRKGGTTYYCAKSVTVINNSITITKGTYTPLLFYNKICTALGTNGVISGTYSRQLKNTVNMLQNGMTLTTDTVYLIVQYGNWLEYISNKNTTTLGQSILIGEPNNQYYKDWNNYPVTIDKDMIFI